MRRGDSKIQPDSILVDQTILAMRKIITMRVRAGARCKHVTSMHAARLNASSPTAEPPLVGTALIVRHNQMAISYSPSPFYQFVSAQQMLNITNAVTLAEREIARLQDRENGAFSVEPHIVAAHVESLECDVLR
jgi:hypothetical protein